jgi:hypothetical protein
MKRNFVHSATLLATAWLLLSCIRSTPGPQLDCALVVDPKFTTFSFDQVSVQGIQAWIQNQYGVSEKDTRITHRSPDPRIVYWEWQFDWHVGNVDYGVTFYREGQSDTTLFARWRSGAPTIGDALRCLGEPSLYRAYWDKHPEAVWTQLELWYPDRGLLVRSLVEHKTAGFDEMAKLSGVTYVRPGSTQEIIPRFWAVQPARPPYERILNSLRVWPGDIKDVEVDTQMD